MLPVSFSKRSPQRHGETLTDGAGMGKPRGNITCIAGLTSRPNSLLDLCPCFNINEASEQNGLLLSTTAIRAPMRFEAADHGATDFAVSSCAKARAYPAETPHGQVRRHIRRCRMCRWFISLARSLSADMSLGMSGRRAANEPERHGSPMEAEASVSAVRRLHLQRIDLT